MDAVANKMIFLIIVLTLLIAVCASVFFHINGNSQIGEMLPFAVGLALSTMLNIAKVVWLKRTVNKTVDMDAPHSAKTYHQVQYFLRLLLTIAILLVAALAPDEVVSLWGAAIGLFTFPVAMRLIQFYVPKDVTVQIPTPTNPVQGAISKMDELTNKGEE